MVVPQLVWRQGVSALCWRPKHGKGAGVAGGDGGRRRRVPGLRSRRAGFKPGLYFYGLRANLVTRLLELGVQPAVICRLTGHKTLAMIDAYNHPADDQFAEARRSWTGQRGTVGTESCHNP